ncbi:MAG: Gfo/Idh/MocA family oxidoreductase [Verrucomicrobiota bacterium]
MKSTPTHAGLPGRPSTRRQFLARTAAASGFFLGPRLLSRSTRAGAQFGRASERLNVGLIGKGAMGSGHLHRLAGDPAIQLVAICEVDRSRREVGKQQVEAIYAAAQGRAAYSGCTAYNDYREMLARPDIDAVLIATPDHWHSLMSIDAAKAGKDVYCEKPVSLTIREGRELVDTVRRCSRVFQTGTQYRSIPTIRQVCDFVRHGGLGPVNSVFTVWGKYDIPTLGPSYIPLDPRLPSEPVPEWLDWDLWVGPGTWRPYNSLYHRNPIPGVVPWVFCDAFGAAAITGYQSHAADVIQYAIGMETSGPTEIHHPSDGDFPTLTFRYPNGILLHHVDHWGMVKDLYKAVPSSARLAGNFGGLFIGERGWMTSMSTGGPIEAAPEKLFDEIKLPSREVTIGANNHHANWFECTQTRARPSSHEEIGHRSASLGHLAIIAYMLERSLRWDPVKEEFIGDDQANRLRSRAMREPWRV